MIAAIGSGLIRKAAAAEPDISRSEQKVRRAGRRAIMIAVINVTFVIFAI
jgi:hypothetical protein